MNRASNKPAASQVVLGVVSTLTKLCGNEAKPDIQALRSRFEAVLTLIQHAAANADIVAQPATSTRDGPAVLYVEPVAVKVKGMRSKTTFVSTIVFNFT